ncbi:MAG TPA: winged helix-turn-helix domain-containing protein [Terriglobales bacterium]|nr:winged helix-turn-helix domain-containing protein [Terriglobales bacterium]
MPEVSQSRVIRFGQFELDAQAGELRKNGVRLRLQQQPFQVLAELLANAGRIVTREELQRKLWPADTFVDFDVGLNTAIRKIRQTLDDDADRPRYIETVAKRGYRFIAPVSPVNGSTPIIAAASSVPLSTDTTAAIEPASPPPRSHFRWLAVALIGAVVGAGGTLAIWKYISRSPELRERRLTANSGEAALKAAAISPDGKLLAYADATGMYLRHADTGEIRSLPLPAGFDLGSVSWFPDNSHLAITGVAVPGAKPSLWQMSSMNGGLKWLIDGGQSAVVSPDGTAIAFVMDDAEKKDSRRREIWIMQSAGTDARRIVQAAGDDWFGPIVWSPDGQYVAYLRVREGPGYSAQSSIETVAVADGHPRVLLSSSLMREGLSWSPDGRILYSTAKEEAPNAEDSVIWSVVVDPVSGKAKSEPVRIARQAGWISKLSITADGKRLAVLRNNTLPQVFVAEYEAGTRRLKVPRRLTLDDSVNCPFAWTPDSKAVFFLSTRNGMQSIFKQAINQPTAELFAGGRDQHFGPRLSPDGSEIFYLVASGTDSNSPVMAMRMPVGGGPSRLLFKEPGIVDLQCARAPSRLCLALAIRSGETFYYPFDPATGRGKEFHAPLADGWGLSPDGSQIAFVEFNGKEDRIRLFSPPTNEWRDVPVNGWSGFKSLDWSPDGKTMIVAASKSRDTSALLEIDTEGNARELLEGQIEWAIPSPDGRYLAVNELVGTNNVWLLENF